MRYIIHPGTKLFGTRAVIDCKYCQVCLKYRRHCSTSSVIHTRVIFRDHFFRFQLIKRLFKVCRVLPKGAYDRYIGIDILDIVLWPNLFRLAQCALLPTAKRMRILNRATRRSRRRTLIWSSPRRTPICRSRPTTAFHIHDTSHTIWPFPSHKFVVN